MVIRCIYVTAPLSWCLIFTTRRHCHTSPGPLRGICLSPTLSIIIRCIYFLIGSSVSLRSSHSSLVPAVRRHRYIIPFTIRCICLNPCLSMVWRCIYVIANDGLVSTTQYMTTLCFYSLQSDYFLFFSNLKFKLLIKFNHLTHKVDQFVIGFIFVLNLLYLILKIL